MGVIPNKMIDVMDWAQCERQFIRHVEKDNEKIKSLVSTATKRIKVIKSIDLNQDSASFIVEGYYEVIKELLTAYLLRNGLRSKNHQCLITYFSIHNKEYEHETTLISQLSFYRNRLEYYGELIPIEFYEQNKKSIQEIITLLFKLVEQSKI